MNILWAVAELYPFVKTGGLGDVAGALPAALSHQGDEVRLCLPAYPAVLDNMAGKIVLRRWKGFPGVRDIRLIKGTLPDGMVAYAVDAPGFYDRANPYIDENGIDWPDNHLRFAALCRAAADLYLCDPTWQPQIIHCNDWHTGLVPTYISWRGYPRPATVLTIHNIAYQGLFPPGVLAEIGLPLQSMDTYGLEYHGQVGFLKAGLYYADWITAVSPTYAKQIQTPEFGAGLDGLLRDRRARLTGIVNGIDEQKWDPASDEKIAARYDSDNLAVKAQNRSALLAEFGLADNPHMPVFGVVSRLNYDKGLDLVIKALPPLLEQGASLVVLGTGVKTLEDEFQTFARQWPHRVGVHIGYDEDRAHRIMAGADSLLVPSRTEPCGLVQLYAQRYGTLPVVRNTGGLADTVNDYAAAPEQATGFVFGRADPAVLEACLHGVRSVFAKPESWLQMQQNAMKKNFSWSAAAQAYRAIYSRLGGEFPAPDERPFFLPSFGTSNGQLVLEKAHKAKKEEVNHGER